MSNDLNRKAWLKVAKKHGLQGYDWDSLDRDCFGLSDDEIGRMLAALICDGDDGLDLPAFDLQPTLLMKKQSAHAYLSILEYDA